MEKFKGIQSTWAGKKLSVLEDEAGNSRMLPIEDRIILLKSSVLVNMSEDLALELLNYDALLTRKEMIKEVEAINGAEL